MVRVHARQPRFRFKIPSKVAGFAVYLRVEAQVAAIGAGQAFANTRWSSKVTSARSSRAFRRRPRRCCGAKAVESGLARWVAPCPHQSPRLCPLEGRSELRPKTTHGMGERQLKRKVNAWEFPDLVASYGRKRCTGSTPLQGERAVPLPSRPRDQTR